MYCMHGAPSQIRVMEKDPNAAAPWLTYIGGPTLLVEIGGLRLLTDPTLDAAGTEYPMAADTLRKTAGPAIARADLGRVDAVLLSHDHHSDNLDREGRALLADVPLILTTAAGAERLGGHARGLAPGETHTIDAPEGGRVRVTATPARHGPEGGDRGPVIGCLVDLEGAPDAAPLGPATGLGLHRGDTVWYPDLAAMRPDLRGVVAFFGAARVAAAGPSPLTLTAEHGIALARHYRGATIVPVHYEDWEHFSEGRREIEQAFAREGRSSRLQWLERGVAAPMRL